MCVFMSRSKATAHLLSATPRGSPTKLTFSAEAEVAKIAARTPPLNFIVAASGGEGL